MKISFHGAAKGVTGSCHLLDCAGLKILIDCGMFQGSRHADEDNSDDFGFDPSDIDFLLLSHAHLDHCGRIPLLVKRGFEGEIITTAATRELAKLIMMDSAHIQEEDASRASRHRRRQGRAGIEPLYDVSDALRALDYFTRNIRYEDPLALNDQVSVRFIDAGHILGSASIVIEASEKGQTRRIVFSGDLGNRGHEVLADPSPPPEADFVVVETTYGDRQHKSLEASVAELLDAIRQTLARGGNVVIPTFALERAQEILFHLKIATERGELPRSLPVFLDSPMAVSATKIFQRQAEGFRPELRDAMRAGKHPFTLPGLRYTRQVAESRAINNVKSGAVIMAGSGMCTGGRVKHHLKHNIWRPESSVIFVGFAAEGTPARKIIDGAKTIRLYGEEITINAHIHTINGFSAHADQQELLEWLSHTGKPQKTFLVHGDPERGMKKFRDKLAARDFATHTPVLHEVVDLLAQT
ncbi:Ribonuclease [Roseovarius litorisediminis]|uniref:Ribonuclease n=1 Tax=Roseovarius litorisediminis TaxID=1312363 RepID=A0A1Y5S638_9RHOB|nr:MBL fold metallo-hydrolase [Roseovarius litorisediminis]SLN30579.1 Ribonuclease [Roseovarius litorisediminis]